MKYKSFRIINLTQQFNRKFKQKLNESRSNGLGLAAVLTIVFLAACQVTEEKTPQDPPLDSQAIEDVGSEQNQERPLPTLAAVIALLDQGELEQAEADLLQIIDQNPRSRLALRFLDQLQSDPVELMGAEHDVITVEPGDSLSMIALRELGDAMQFFALARYNGIDAPRRMAPGIELKIPHALQPSEATDTEPSESDALVDEPPQDAELPPGAGLALAGQNLIDDGRFSQAIALLSAAANAGNLDASGEALLVDATIKQVEQLKAEGQQDQAATLIAQVTELVSPQSKDLLEPARLSLEVTRLENEAIQARRAGELNRALTLFEHALRLDPDNTDIQTEANNLRDVLVAQLHDQALIHYRDQELDQAIELWQRVQSLAPNFESAQIYLERAQALRDRLRVLD